MLAVFWLTIAACMVMPLVGRFWVSKVHLAIVGACFAATKVAVYTTIWNADR